VPCQRPSGTVFLGLLAPREPPEVKVVYPRDVIRRVSFILESGVLIAACGSSPAEPVAPVAVAPRSNIVHARSEQQVPVPPGWPDHCPFLPGGTNRAARGDDPSLSIWAYAAVASNLLRTHMLREAIADGWECTPARAPGSDSLEPSALRCVRESRVVRASDHLPTHRIDAPTRRSLSLTRHRLQPRRGWRHLPRGTTARRRSRPWQVGQSRTSSRWLRWRSMAQSAREDFMTSSP